MSYLFVFLEESFEKINSIIFWIVEQFVSLFLNFGHQLFNLVTILLPMTLERNEQNEVHCRCYLHCR